MNFKRWPAFDYLSQFGHWPSGINQWVQLALVIEAAAFAVLLLCIVFAQRDENHP